LTTLFREEAHIGSIKCTAGSPDGKWFASGGQDELLRVFDATKLVDFGTLHQHSGAIVLIRFFGPKTAISAGLDGKLCVWSTKPWAHIATLNAHKSVFVFFFIYCSVFRYPLFFFVWVFSLQSGVE
jgi:WD40 repeat protein